MKEKISHPDGAVLQLDTAAAGWIGDRLLPWGGDVGTRVCAIVPTGYEAYLRVFHHADEHTGTETIRRRWSELAQRSGRQMHPAVQFDRFAWPNPPQIGSLDRHEATTLVSMLRPHTTTPDACWLAIWHGFGQLTGSVHEHVVGRALDARIHRLFAARSNSLAPPRDLAAAPTVSLPNREYFLYRGPIGVVPRFEHLPGHLQTPNMWWPEDRAWFVATEIDFDSTLVACTRSCALGLLAGDLEVMEVSAETRLDIDGDTVNINRSSGPSTLP
ncbi:MAG TPA: hypothetical protein VFS23_27310 [Vicinamibacterales bacterium]|nr:hypothetical protein [Vicinamibacterales bacterium]